MIESHLPSRKDSVRKIVPEIVPEVVSPNAGGTSDDSDWCEDTKTASDDVRMTIAMSGHAPDVQEVAEQSEGAREWYWSQVVKRSNALAHRLIGKRLVGADVGRTVALLHQLEEKATSLETEIALAESRYTELYAMTRESEARLRYAVVDLSVERGRNLDQGAHPQYFADVDFQIQNLEQSLDGLFLQKESSGAQFEEAIRRRVDQLRQLRQEQTNAEIQLINLLHRERPPQVSPEIQSAYDRLEDLLRTLQMTALPVASG